VVPSVEVEDRELSFAYIEYAERSALLIRCGNPIRCYSHPEKSPLLSYMADDIA
jgi:hypothetical protein